MTGKSDHLDWSAAVGSMLLTMDVQLPDEVSEQLTDATKALASLKGCLKHVLQLLSNTKEPLTPLDKAQALQAVCLAVHALQQLYIRTRGVDPQSVDAVQQERQRLEKYTQKVNKAMAAKILKESRPSISLNVGAANRFIDHAIPDLTPQQRAALQSATATLKRKAAELDEQWKPKSQARSAGPGKPGDRKSSAKEAAVAFLEGLKADRNTAAVGVAVPVQEQGSDSGTEEEQVTKD